MKALHHVRGSGELRIPQNSVKVVPEPYRICGRHPHLIVHGDCTKVSLLEIINHTHQLWVVALNVESYFVEGLLNVSHRDKSKKHRQPCGSSKYLILEILNLKLLMNVPLNRLAEVKVAVANLPPWQTILKSIHNSDQLCIVKRA